MKMETTATALKDGTISSVNLKEGEMVITGDLILSID
jgi:biotin carboxyl carrier protein